MSTIGEKEWESPCAECDCKQVEDQYEVIVTIPEGNWNEEVQRYIFFNDAMREIVVTKDKEFTFVTTSRWRVGEILSSRLFDTVKVSKVKPTNDEKI